MKWLTDFAKGRNVGKSIALLLLLKEFATGMILLSSLKKQPTLIQEYLYLGIFNAVVRRLLLTGYLQAV
ncbi:hypothetical protein D3C84_1225980 [compost metagenome]